MRWSMALLSVLLAAFAQASVQCLVLDPSGAAIPDATITDMLDAATCAQPAAGPTAVTAFPPCLCCIASTAQYPFLKSANYLSFTACLDASRDLSH
jgi:hypothetical protein